jgi:SAM-dependent methyltransferase
MNDRTDTVWQSQEVIGRYLTGVRRYIPLAAEQLDVMLRVVANRPEPVSSFLDLGCGDGILAGVILDRYPNAAGTLLDFAQPMLDAARQKLANVSAGLHFVQADYATPAWLETVQNRAPFDLIVSGYSIHHQPDSRKQDLYAEIFNLLQPGGMFINVEHVASPSAWTEELWNTLFIDALWQMYYDQGQPKSREQIRSDFLNSEESAANIVTLTETQCDWLRGIGFVHVDCYFKIFELAVFGGVRPPATVGGQ